MSNIAQFVARHRGAGAVATALIRTGFSVGLVLVPGAMAKPWAGEAAADPGVKHLNRGYGARDLVLGLGTYQALRAKDPAARRWLQAAAVADAVDALSTLTSFKSSPKASATIAVAVSTVAAVFGFYAANTVLDDQNEGNAE
jgi:hypothetical protein